MDVGLALTSPKRVGLPCVISRKTGACWIPCSSGMCARNSGLRVTWTLVAKTGRSLPADIVRSPAPGEKRRRRGPDHRVCSRACCWRFDARRIAAARLAGADRLGSCRRGVCQLMSTWLLLQLAISTTVVSLSVLIHLGGILALIRLMRLHTRRLMTRHLAL